MVRRTKKVIERSPADAIAVYMTLRGDAWFECADRTYALRPGDVLVSETDQPFARGFSRGLEELVVKVDRAALPEVPPLSRPVIASFRQRWPDRPIRAGRWPESPGQATRTSRSPAGRREHGARPDRGAGRGTRRGSSHSAPRRRTLLYRGEPERIPASAPNKSRRRSGSVSGNCPGSSPPTAYPSPGTSCPAACTSPTRCCAAPGRREGRDRGRHRCPVRLYVGDVLLPRLPQALRPPRQRHPRSALEGRKKDNSKTSTVNCCPRLSGQFTNMSSQ